MRNKELIKEIEYNKQYLELKSENGKVLDGNSYISNTLSLERTVYNAEDLVGLTDKAKEIVSEVKNNFIETFSNRGGATKEQIHFAEETAKIIFGDFKKNIVCCVPAAPGFGKSSIILEILQKQIELYKNNETEKGIIIVTDRLDSLRECEKELKNKGLSGYVYILEGWNENICSNKKIKQSESKICTPNCPYFYKCKISLQQKEQNKYPVLMITNARLREMGTAINQYQSYEGGQRTTLIIDERPDVIDTVKVNKRLLNEISTEIDKCNYETVEEKTILQNKWKEIDSILTGKMQRLRTKYKRFIVSNINNECICKNDSDFMKLWNKYMNSKFKRELNHIHEVLTRGGFYVYEANTEFISTIKSKDLKEMYSCQFKTVIFDGTALYDPLYLGMYEKGSIKFLDIENTRLYSNLTINTYIKHKLNKTAFRNKKYFVSACAKFVNERMKIGFNKGYVVTYQEQSVHMAQKINSTLKYNIAKLREDELFYFGNTKGKNDMQDCNIMFQFGWDTMPDYEYVIEWLSVCVKWDNLIEHCSVAENAEEISEKMIVKDRSKETYNNRTYSSQFKCYEYGLQGANQFKMFYIVTNFYQEIHRTKLRQYTCTKEKIEVNIFSQKQIILNMIQQLFPMCNLNIVTEELSCFKESKSEDRVNKAKGYDEFLNWYSGWNGELIKAKDIKSICNLNDKQWENLKKHDVISEKLSILQQPKRGQYCR